MKHDLWILHLRPNNRDPYPVLTVRRALKCLLRSFRLRCEWMELKRAQADPDTSPAPAAHHPAVGV